MKLSVQYEGRSYGGGREVRSYTVVVWRVSPDRDVIVDIRHDRVHGRGLSEHGDEASVYGGRLEMRRDQAILLAEAILGHCKDPIAATFKVALQETLSDEELARISEEDDEAGQ